MARKQLLDGSQVLKVTRIDPAGARLRVRVRRPGGQVEVLLLSPEEYQQLSPVLIGGEPNRLGDSHPEPGGSP